MNRLNVFRTTPNILMGTKAIQNVGEEALKLGARRVLIITDKGVLGAGLIQPVENSLKQAHVRSIVFDEVESDSRYEIVEYCCNKIKGESLTVSSVLEGGVR